MKASARWICGLLMALAIALGPSTANADERGGASDSAVFYTLVDGDAQPTELLMHMGISGPDAFREMLLWNPQLHNIYALAPGTRLRVPGFGPRPSFPAFESDYSKRKIIGNHTTRFVGAPWERVTNIIVSAHAVDNSLPHSAQ